MFILQNNIKAHHRKNKGWACKIGSEGAAVGLVLLQRELVESFKNQWKKILKIKAQLLYSQSRKYCVSSSIFQSSKI